jgi:hypothetical protein
MTRLGDRSPSVRGCFVSRLAPAVRSDAARASHESAGDRDGAVVTGDIALGGHEGVVVALALDVVVPR